MSNSLTHKPKTLRSRVLSGSFILLSGSGLATTLSLAYNILVARFLGPSGYGTATAVYTLLTLLSSVTLSFQLVSAKIVAQQRSPEAKSAGYRGFQRAGWACGIFAALLLTLFQIPISNYLNLPNSFLVVTIAIGIAFYIPLGSRRGYLQGAYGFRRLASNLVLEGAIRLGGSLLLILFGLGVEGVIAANSAAVIVAYFVITPRLAARVRNPVRLNHGLREMLQAMVFFAGQVLINNCDIVLVKHFFVAEAAGLYAVIAMVGRVVFSFSQAIVNSMFPLVAGTQEEERKDLTVIATALALVLGIGSALALVLRVMPASVWMRLFGARFHTIGSYSLSYLLALYAITAVIYSLSAVVIAYEMSYKIANTSWIQFAFSAVVIGGICLFHSSLRQVILVQLVLMVILFGLVALPFLSNQLLDKDKSQLNRVFPPVRVLRPVSEDEVIAEFLKSDFHNPIYREYQDSMREIVTRPRLDNLEDNAKRRAVFFTRHLQLWNELPSGTEWYEVEMGEAGLDQIRVFPRAQWRKLARGNFSITGVAECIRKGESVVDSRFRTKIQEIGERMQQDDTALGAVIVIGMGERSPFTILDGNHRLVAAMLTSPPRVSSLRFLCGLSPKMTECCWYNTNLMTLLRYGKNVFSQFVRIPKADRAGALQSSLMPETMPETRE